MESWSDTDTDPSTLVQNLTGTPMYMAIDVLRGSRHSPSTEVESLFYTILAVCTDGRLSDRGANFAEDPRTAAKLRRGGMIESELEELQHAPQDKHDFLKTLHDLFFPWGQVHNAFITTMSRLRPSRQLARSSSLQVCKSWLLITCAAAETCLMRAVLGACAQADREIFHLQSLLNAKNPSLAQVPLCGMLVDCLELHFALWTPFNMSGR